ncbi:branched-chain amino acid ABC transporter substrate-binding protein [Ramlibacter sp.]|uniref:branched-chain amino acid ABC transporter substrate-binding protein n=1 Tax=Ramlibacter sp. TaxID=1917967 RepID=UPI0017EC6DAA|nr:branched-chain amino acid ABC transporter substrate-binding protein [Ramlibacter sp.]MBA2672594.1 branched-chain amino acid ABC transporter substrate-binding protein [Ramlibacter sp.]
MTLPPRRLFGALALLLALAAPATHAETVRIAMIEMMSGPLGATGHNLLRSYQTFAETAARENWTGAGHTLEFTGFDNKGSPQESLALLKTAIDQGYRYVAQGTSSEIAAVLIEALNDHNARNPGREVLFINHAAVDPDLTNQKCSFWHFRFDAHVDMKMEGLTSLMAADPNVKKVYLVGQDYSFGRQVSRAAHEFLQRKRPDVEIVGDELHPIGRVRDFSPYVARIKASGADTVLTGDWGSDLALLIKAAREADLKATFYTYYAGMSSGVMNTMGADEVGRVKQIGNWHANIENFPGKDVQEAFRRKYKENFYATPTYTIVAMLTKAIAKAGSTEPLKVALALENLSIRGFAGGDVTMRAEDHQVQGTLFLSTWAKANGRDVRFDEEDTGYGWKPDRSLAPQTVMLPTTCRMQRPVAAR